MLGELPRRRATRRRGCVVQKYYEMRHFVVYHNPDAMPYPAGFYNDPRMPLMYAIRAEGIDL